MVRIRRITPVVAGLLAFVSLLLTSPAARAAVSGSSVAVYPSPGDQYEQPATQIVFRGIAPSSIGTVTVVGSETGAHTGRLEADSDGLGASFVPAKPFLGGETVTVTTGLNIVGGSHGRFQFSIEHPAANLPAEALPVASGPNDLQHFNSRPDLQPPSIVISRDSEPVSDGDIFVAPQFGPSQDGPMILDPRGNLIWFLPYPIARKTLVTDFRTQELGGQPVLTWWQGTTNSGSGRGEGVIFNRSYQEVTTVHAANGLQMDLHEFTITNSGDAYLVAVAPVRLPGIARPVQNSVVQEIDMKTGLVLFQWDALDHVSVDDSYLYGPKESGHVLDPFHMNSVSVDAYGNVVVSMRNTSAVYDIQRATGAVLWTLGGRHSTFKMGPGTTTGLQHDAVVQPNGDITIFDDGAGPPQVHTSSRGIEVAINTVKRTATLVRQISHSPSLLADFEGSYQPLPSGDVFLGWGQQPYFSEVNAQGQTDFDAHFTAPTSSYRAYRMPWSAQPPTNPNLAVGTILDGDTTLYESWNGATDVAAWRVLAGPSPSRLAPLGRYVKYRFESALTPGTGDRFVQVQALGSAGQILARSIVHAVPAHAQVFASSVFVSSSSGLAGLPVGCYTAKPCHLSATVTEGRSVYARSGSQYFAAGTGGTLYFRLSPDAQSELAEAKSRRLAVAVTVSDSSGAQPATTGLELVPFTTQGAGPARSYSQGSTIRILAGTDFVSDKGVGAQLVECLSSTPCRVSATVNQAGRDIAVTKPEYVGANQVGDVFFSLDASGQSLVSHAAGNQLGVAMSITGSGKTASANVALVGFR